MACAGVDEMETEWDQVKKMITCFICKKIFSDPITLPCLHTFCKQCIEDRTEQAKQNERSPDSDGSDNEYEYINTASCCPLCLASLPLDGASSMCIDASMNCLIEIYKRKLTGQGSLVEVTCGNCNEELRQVTTWCLICNCALCAKCHIVHNKQKGYDVHTTVAIAEFVRTCRGPCRTHTHQVLDFYCSTCNLVTCKDCIVEDHLEHHFDLVDKHVRKAKQIITPLREMAERARSRNKRAIKIPKRQTKNDNPPLYVGMYDFLATDYNELSFSKGDLLYIISDDGDWWFAKAKETGQEGYIPRTFIVKSRPLENEEWFFGTIDLQEAKRKLLHSCNTDGAFLVYENKESSGEYSLAVRKTDKVSHYRIRKKSDQYFIDLKITFASVQELLAHYSKSGNNSFIKTTLKRPCSKTELQSNVHAPSGVLEIDKKAICFVKNLGAGQVGVVWQGVWNAITPVAVKIIKPGLVGMTEFLEEVAAIKRLKHPNLIELYAVSTKEEPIYIVTELSSKHGSLVHYLRGDGLTLKLAQLVNILAQVASGMAYLEEKGFIHCNLAARNVLVCENLICKVTDYAYGQFIFYQVQHEDFCIKWTAPEAVLHRRFTIKSDVWSFGILIYEVITYGSFPYPGMNNALVLKDLKRGSRMWRPIGCPESLYTIMRNCWKGDAESRPTFETLQWQLEEFFID